MEQLKMKGVNQKNNIYTFDILITLENCEGNAKSIKKKYYYD